MTAGQGGRGAGGGRVVVDVGALCANYAHIERLVAPARLGAVVKANAYGLGADVLAPALAAVGCRSFFVAFLEEALALKARLPADAEIHVLNGLAGGEEVACAEAGVLPVLNSFDQAARWIDAARAAGRRLPATVQVDSGMSRLGLAPEELDRLLVSDAFATWIDVRLLMTHLACAEAPDAVSNRRQLSVFRGLASLFPVRPRLSIANSAGGFLGAAFHGDLVRAGLALYGAAPSPAQAGLLRPVVRVEARVAQVRSICAGAGVGYGLAFTAPRPSRIATLAVGYADGWPRRLGGRSSVAFDGRSAPIVGRVSMDSLTVDVTDLPDAAVREGAYAELIGPLAPLEAVAEAAETIPYEILTGLGPRLARVHVGAPAISEQACA